MYPCLFCKMNAVHAMLTAKRKALDLQSQSQANQNKYEYDSDEDTDGGTWEHKTRVREMAATRGRIIMWNNHILDFLKWGCYRNFKIWVKQ